MYIFRQFLGDAVLMSPTKTPTANESLVKFDSKSYIIDSISKTDDAMLSVTARYINNNAEVIQCKFEQLYVKKVG